MRELSTQAEVIKRLEKIYTTDESEVSTELYRQLILDALRFYGASLQCQMLVEPSTRDVCRIARLATKSECDSYLVGKHGVDRFWAHSATNTITHHNLPSCEPGDMADMVEHAFYVKFCEIQQEKPYERRIKTEEANPQKS